MAKRNFDDFDEYADRYRDIHSANVKMSGADSFYFAEQKVLEIKKYESEPALRLLDVGCGDGATEIYFQKYFPGWKLEGIDVSGQSLQKAVKRNIGAASFGLYNGTEIPFEKESFDIVFIAAVLHHIHFSLHDQLIQEIHRVLKPGGRLYVFEHNPYNPVTRYFVNTCPFDKDAKLLTASYTKKMLRKFFNEVQVRYTLFFPRKGVLSKLISMEDKLGWLPLGGQFYCKAKKTSIAGSKSS